MSCMQTGLRPEGAGAPISAIGRGRSREERLEAILRRMLPGVNLGGLDARLRADLFREFAELRSGGIHADSVAFTGGRCLLWFDGPLLSSVDAGGREGILMRIPEDEAGAHFLLAVPAARVMADLRAGRTCLRTACLDEGTRLFLADDCVEGEARVLTGPVHEYLLPEEGLLVSGCFADPDEPDGPGGP